MANLQLTIGAVLRRVKSLKGRMSKLEQRANGCVSYDRDHKPVFVFAEVEKELDTTRKELVAYSAALARANVETTIRFREEEMPLAAAVRRLDEIKSHKGWLENLPIKEGETISHENDYDEVNNRSIRRKIVTTYVSAVSEADRVRRIEELQKEFDELNDVVETTNMTTKVEFRA